MRTGSADGRVAAHGLEGAGAQGNACARGPPGQLPSMHDFTLTTSFRTVHDLYHASVMQILSPALCRGSTA